MLVCVCDYNQLVSQIFSCTYESFIKEQVSKLTLCTRGDHHEGRVSFPWIAPAEQLPHSGAQAQKHFNYESDKSNMKLESHTLTFRWCAVHADAELQNNVLLLCSWLYDLLQLLPMFFIPHYIEVFANLPATKCKDELCTHTHVIMPH